MCVMCVTPQNLSLQTEEFSTLDEEDEGATSQSIAVDQEVSLTETDTPDQLHQEVIVIVTDTESEEDQEEEEEQVVFVEIFLKEICLVKLSQASNHCFTCLVFH